MIEFGIDPEQHERLMDEDNRWLTDRGIDPFMVPSTVVFRMDEEAGTLTYDRIVPEPSGRTYADGLPMRKIANGKFVCEQVTVPVGSFDLPPGAGPVA